jgi:hypothetical protein
MGATPKYEVDNAELNRTLRSFVGVMRKELSTEIRNQARLACRDAINYTPPLIKGSPTYQTVAPMEQRRAGEKAVRRDVAKVYLALEDLRISDDAKFPHLAKWLHRYGRQGATGKVEKILRDFQWNVPVSREALPGAHESARNHRGRVNARRARNIVLSKRTIEQYTRKQQKKVGRAKAGWNNSAAKLGLKVPNWVGDLKEPGWSDDKLSSPNPSFTLANTVRHAQRAAPEILQRVMNNRDRAMKVQINKVMEKITKAASGRR